MKEDTPLKFIMLYFTFKVLFIFIGVILFIFNIPHIPFFNFLFEDTSLYNFSIIIPILILIGYIYVLKGFQQRSNLARSISIVLCFITLFVFPFGTIISSLIIGYLIFFEKGTFQENKKHNIPFRATGIALIGISIIGFMSITGMVTCISENIGFGYGNFQMASVSDFGSGDVDVIIQLKGAGIQSIETQNVIIQDISNTGGIVTGRTLYVANTIIATIDRNEINNLMNNPNIVQVIPDKKIFNIVDLNPPMVNLLDNNHDIINADPLWKNGINGSGIVVAVVDTGINGNIPALTRSGESVVIDSYELYGDYAHSHGTLCASCIASQDSTYRGIAPDADLIDIGVFQSDGSAYTSDILQGWDYVANWKQTHDRFVICSNSFGADSWSDMGVTSGAANKMSQTYGIPMICAAGNEGPDAQSIATPGIAEHVLAVGAVDDNNVIAFFSSRGPGSISDKKPDIVAPGVNVYMFDETGSISTHSGTSFSTPIVAGATALLAQGHEGYSPSQIYNAFRRGAVDLGNSGFDYEYGYGLIDVFRSYEMIENEIPQSSYIYFFIGFIILGIGIISYPEWKQRLSYG